MREELSADIVVADSRLCLTVCRYGLILPPCSLSCLAVQLFAKHLVLPDPPPGWDAAGKG